MTPDVKKVLIVGAGPSGLTAAISIARLGIKVEVVDVSVEDTVLGSELSLSGSMLRALAQLDLADACVAEGVPVSEMRFCDAEGKVLSTIFLPTVADPKYPPTVGITRASLHRILLNAARKSGVNVRYETTVSEIKAEDNGVTVTDSHGSTKSYDLVVGADGLRSVVRSLVFPDAPNPHFTGQGVWRARLPRHEIDNLHVYYGPHGKAGLLPVSKTAMYLFLLVPATDTTRLNREEQPAALRAALSDFSGTVKWACEHIFDPAHVHYAPLENLILPSPWHRHNRVLLIGDAAHATTPHLAFGAGAAVEDGVVLGEELSRENNLAAALDSFMARRFARCEMIVKNAEQLGVWELNPTEETSAASVQLSEETWRKLAEPI